MQHKRPPIPVIVIAALAVLTGGYFLVRSLLSKSNGELTASGTIEVVEVTVSPELGGKVAEVLVDEGASVKTGEVLFRLDDSLLQAQRAVAAAGLDSARAAAATADAAATTAQAQYDLALNAARLESAAGRTSSWRTSNPPGYTLPGWYFGPEEALRAAQAEADAARSAHQAAQTRLDGLLNDPANASFLAIEKRLAEARAAFLVAQDVRTRANQALDNADLQSAAQTAYDDARKELDDSQSAYDGLQDGEAAKSILTARAELAAARERYEAAQDRLLALQTGPDSPKVAAAHAALQQALDAVEQAHRAVTQAEASLKLLDVQIGKLAVKAPADGVILTRVIEPGEVVSPGGAAITLGRLENLTITVYVPEDRYGEIKLGQSASVAVDSFPGQTFTAKVTHIADQAEFTPRNVQTVEGRKSTVYAVKLTVEDPSGKLKPGMPADVTFK